MKNWKKELKNKNANKTQRLKIRTLQDSDLNDVFDIYKDEETCKYLLHNSWNEKNKNEEFKEKLSKQSLEKDFAINLACILRWCSNWWDKYLEYTDERLCWNRLLF